MGAETFPRSVNHHIGVIKRLYQSVLCFQKSKLADVPSHSSVDKGAISSKCDRAMTDLQEELDKQRVHLSKLQTSIASLKTQLSSDIGVSRNRDTEDVQLNRYSVLKKTLACNCFRN